MKDKREILLIVLPCISAILSAIQVVLILTLF